MELRIKNFQLFLFLSHHGIHSNGRGNSSNPDFIFFPHLLTSKCWVIMYVSFKFFINLLLSAFITDFICTLACYGGFLFTTLLPCLVSLVLFAIPFYQIEMTSHSSFDRKILMFLFEEFND